MLNRDSFFKKNDDAARRAVNVTPALSNPAPLNDTNARATVGTVPRPETPPSPERAKPAQTSGSRLIVGPDIKLKGVEITDCDTLVVEGTVSIDIAEIHGRFEGELTAREQLIIHATGRVSGKIRYGKIQVEEGGELAGDIAKTDSKTEKADTRLLRAAQPTFKTASSD